VIRTSAVFRPVIKLLLNDQTIDDTEELEADSTATTGGSNGAGGAERLQPQGGGSAARRY